MDLDLKLDGADKLAALFKKVEGVGKSNALKQAMFAEATTVLNESKKIVPVDLGTLKRSGEVEPPKVDSSGIEVSITYGGAASEYALIVHEDMTARHKDGQSAKYLEKPFMAHQGKFVRNVTERVAQYIRSGM